MRTAAQTLQERAPEALAIEAIEQEMVQNLHMKLEHAAAWVTAVRAHFSNVVNLSSTFKMRDSLSDGAWASGGESLSCTPVSAIERALRAVTMFQGFLHWLDEGRWMASSKPSAG